MLLSFYFLKNSSISTFRKSPKTVFRISSPLEPWTEEGGKKGNRGGGGKEKKCTSAGLTTGKILVGRIFGGKVSTYDHDWTAAFRFPDFSPSVAVGARFFSLWVQRATRYKLVHASYEAVAPLCEASGLEPREIPRPITCGSQLWIN